MYVATVRRKDPDSIPLTSNYCRLESLVGVNLHKTHLLIDFGEPLLTFICNVMSVIKIGDTKGSLHFRQLLGVWTIFALVQWFCEGL